MSEKLISKGVREKSFLSLFNILTEDIGNISIVRPQNLMVNIMCFFWLICIIYIANLHYFFNNI